MEGGGLGDVSLDHRAPERLLNDRLVKVVSVRNTSMPIHVVTGGGEDILPAPRAICVGVFARQCIGKRGSAETFAEVSVVEWSHLRQVADQARE
jgi:hypothetical protein